LSPRSRSHNRGGGWGGEGPGIFKDSEEAVNKVTWIGVAAATLTLMVGPAAMAAAPPPMDVGPATTQTLAVYGDAPYGISSTDNSQTLATPAFIDSINGDADVQTVMHVGDIHSGKQFCTQAYDQTVFDLWTQFKDPLVYTPGDNEWTDCHKPGEGGGLTDPAGNPVDYANGDPIANLALIRSIFFPHPGVTLGMNKKLVLSQATWARFFDRTNAADAQFVENVIFVQGRTLFVTINLPGGSNNDNDVWYGAPTQSVAQMNEIRERTGADLRWLDLAFAIAGADRRIGSIVIGAQADMWDPEKGAAHQSGFEPVVKSIAAHVTAFKKPVLMFNGDSHVYQSRNPLVRLDPLPPEGDPVYDTHPGYDRDPLHYDVSNFHRIVVHGSTTPLEWLKLTIDPSASNDRRSGTSFGPFSWERKIRP
jgi:hypothetical protein